MSKINRDVVAIVQTPEVKAKFAAQFVMPRADTPEEFDRIIRDQTAQLTEVFKGMTP